MIQPGDPRHPCPICSGRAVGFHVRPCDPVAVVYPLARIAPVAHDRPMPQPDPPELNDDPVEVCDAELLAEYQKSDGNPADPAVEAIVREIERRGLDI